MQNISSEGMIQFPNISLNASIINNAEYMKGSLYNRIIEKEQSILFQVTKQTCEITCMKYNLYNIYDSSNTTFQTNLGYIIKEIVNSRYSNLFSVGKTYYLSVKDKIRSCDIRIKRKNEESIEAEFNIKAPKNKKIKGILNAFNEWKTKNYLGIELKGESSYDNIKSLVFKSYLKSTKKLYTMTSNSSLNINKKNIADLLLQYKTKEGNSPFELKMTNKGQYNINSKAMIDIKKVKFSHSIDVKDKTYKSVLLSSSSICRISSEFNCYLNHSNNARDMVVGMTWMQNLKILETQWNKKKGHGFLFVHERKNEDIIITLSTPLRTAKISKIKKYTNDETRNLLVIEIIRKTFLDKSLSISLDYLMKGSIDTAYDLDLRLNSNFMQKDILILINRQLSMTEKDIYMLNVKTTFDGDQKPFFTLEGYLRQLSSISYELKINATNNDQFLAIISTTSISSGEITFEYKVYQNNKIPKEFIFQFIPFRKFLLTNKNDINILISRTIYQYGYRNYVKFNLGKNGQNINAFDTFIKIPLKYYAEILDDRKKLVIYFRPVGNTFIGEVYRNVKGSKVSDMSMKVELDFNNILVTNIYWSTKSIDVFKKWFNTTFKQENLRVLMITAYDSYENQISTFTSKIKLELVKKMNIQKSLNFMKDLVNDIEQIPKVLTQTYNDDSLFIKSFLENMKKYFEKIKITEFISQKQNNMSKIFSSFSDKLYEWFINADIYGSIYDLINNHIQAITYPDIKVAIGKVVKIAKFIGETLNFQIKNMSNALDTLRVMTLEYNVLAIKFKEKMIEAYNGSSINQLIIFLGDIKDELQNVLNEIAEAKFIKERIEYYKESIENIKEFIIMINKMKTQVMNYVTSSSLVGSIIKTMELIRSIKYKEAFLNLIKPAEGKFDIDLDKATIDIKLYISPIFRFMINFWKTTLDWFPFEIISEIRGSGFSGKLLSLFYKYQYLIFNYGSVGSLKSLIPPFERTAWILKGNSIITYDGNSIRIGNGKCSYLLARDTKGGSFSLVMNVLTNIKSFDIFYIKKITLLSSGMVKVNNKDIHNLPQILTSRGKTIEINRNYDVVKIKTSEGLIVEYFNNLDYLKVTLSGYWHGAVKGLLGSNDFEKINDLATPIGRITHDAGILSNSWSIDTCKSETMIGLYKNKVNYKQFQRCVGQFKRDSLSYLDRCFPLIDPQPYFELCQSSLHYKKMKDKEFDKFICDLSRNYVMRCKSQGIMIRLDKTCITCGTKKLSEVNSNSNLRIYLKFHYIFIMEQSKCLVPHKGLFDNLLRIMSMEKNNIYSLLSFNGRTIFKSAHFKSLNSGITTDIKGFKTLLSDAMSLTQISGHLLYNSSTEPSQAIFEAVKMPSKSGYIEKIVLISCSTCGKHQKHIFSFLAQLLNKSGMSLTYVTAQPFRSQVSKLESIGIGNNLLHYFEKDILKKKVLNKEVQPPNDECSNLARLNDGFVWSLNHINSQMRIRRFTESLHSELIKVNGRTKQKCVCRTGNYEDGVLKCEVRG